ncbi:MAG: Ig-like domain-containing protein [Ferruginibacter sp.]
MPRIIIPENLRKLITVFFLLLATIGVVSAQNPIPAENALPGTPKTDWDSYDGDNIQGFATKMSVNKGETVDFKININSPTPVSYTVQIYRVGYYQGNGARFIDDLGPSLTGQSQPVYNYESSTGKVDCSNWSVSASWTVPSNAVSGVYFARLKCTAVNSSELVLFIVRDDASTSPLLIKTSDATWQAYNYYGGNTYYAAATPVPGFTHATKVSYQRPIHVRSNFSSFWNSEFPMVMWLERNGYHVSYTTDWDMARTSTPITPANHKVIMSSGHDEYWSAEERNRIESARNSGVHLAFFSGNTAYWKTRWEDNFQTMVCYKEGLTGIYSCGTKCDPNPNVWTGAWRDGCLASYTSNDACKPEGGLLGQMGWIESTGSIEVPYTHKNFRIWKNTTIPSLTTGQKATLPLGTLGAEWDQEQFVETFPAHRIPLTFTTLNGLNHSVCLFKYEPSGALVFSTGTLQWAWGLEALHDNLSGPASADMQQATVNLLFDMGVSAETLQAGLVTPTANTDVQAPTTTIVTPVHNSSVPGSPITISGTAVDNGGGAVGGVEVSTDNGNTWHRASGFETWSYTFSPTGYGNINIKVRAWDDAFNVETPGPLGSSNAITITLTGPFTYSVFNASYPAGTPDYFHIAGDIELGMKFRSTIPGYITGFRYYKGASVDGQHIGHLWASDGTLLATEPFVNETTSGWQSVQLNSPVAITANTTYIVSYYAASGKYSFTNPFFNQAIVNGPLRGLANGEDGGNGLANYPGTGFPTLVSGTTNYYADVIFTSSDVTPPTVSSVNPANSSTGALVTVHPTATFDEAIDPGTVTTSTVVVTGPGNAIIPGTVSINSAVITFTPSALLAPNTTYTITLKGGSVEPVIKDLSGNALANDYVWSFTTEDPQAPTVTTNPSPETTCPNNSVSFTSAANGIPLPTVQWQVSTDNGNSWNDVIGAVNSTYTFTAVLADNGKLYRAVWTNASGSANSNSALLTVNPNGNAGTVLGTSPLCIGSTATYITDGDAGGTWSSSNTSVATIDQTGFVTAIAAGTVNITYSVCGSSSNATLVVSPNATAGTISGTTPLCINATAAYSSNGDAGGTWSSSNTSVVTVDGAGNVTAINPGVANIFYTVSSGCNSPVSAFKTVTVNPNANAGVIRGQGRLCVGSSATYTSTGDPIGTWSSLAPAVATINPTTGVATAVSEGFADFVYTVSTGCGAPVQAFYTIQVQTDMDAGTVSGASPVCSGVTTTYTSSGVIGGLWSSSNTAVATVNQYTGVVTTIAGGTTTITYTLVGCGNTPVTATKLLTVNQDATAGIVTGSSPLCIGATATYISTGDAGGSWTSSNPGVATVNPTTGEVTGVAEGSTTITYTVTACNGTASASATVVVNPSVNPGIVLGASPLCIGASATYITTGDPGGVWSTSNTALATINGVTREVTAHDAGTLSILYTIPGCNGTASATLVINPDANAGVITGTSPLCIGAPATYTSNGDAGGTWSSSNTSVATIDANTGAVTTLAAGTTTISYTISSGCASPSTATKVLTVSPNANAGVISGQGRLCVGSSATYTSNGDAGGTWTSLEPGIASIDPNTGVATAVTEGFADFIYTVSTGCGAPLQAYYTILVQTSISAGTVTGTTPLCIGATATYTSNGVVGGSWSSSNTSVATVNPATGLVTAVGAGTTNIIYTLVGCGNVAETASQSLTVNANVNAGTVSGTTPLCIGATATYTTDGDAGGSWSSTNTGVATVNPTTGLVTAVGAGTTDITYTVTACNGTASATKTLVVSTNANPGIILGASPLCIGANATYISTGDAGGTWSSSNTSVATIDANTGSVTAVGAGTTTISYTVPGCNGTTTTTLTVSANANAGVITGTSPLCIGAPATYTSNGDAGGTWSSSNTSVATIDANTGAVTTLAAGTTTISYTISSGCASPSTATKVLTVSPNANAGVISGQGRLCVGSSATYTSNGDAGGTWTSLEPGIASIDPNTGVATAVTEGFADFIYTVSTGCGAPLQAYYTILVQTSISAGTVTGTTPLCIGATATYTSNGVVGGSWSSSNTSVATVNPATGLVTAVGAGTTNIIYTLVGCGNVAETASQSLTVNANVNAGTVSGTTPLCIGATATYTTDGDAGGSWSSTNTGVATVNPTTGLVTAVGAGTTDITYTVTACNGTASATKTLVVSTNANPGIILGASPLCIGANATYISTGDAGGTWSSSNTSVATIDANTGSVTAVGAGTTTISYTVPGCNGTTTTTLTVSANANAGVITGTSPLCIGAPATYTSNGDAGGTWSSSNTSVATIDANTGAVTTLAAGTTTISYTVSTGCNAPSIATKVLTVNPNVNAGVISGQGRLCVGSSATYTSNGDAGGTWNSLAPGIATIDANTGVALAVSTGFADFVYSVNTGCGAPAQAYYTIEVLSSNPNPGVVSGTTPLCIGATATYTSNGIVGGTWSSTNTAAATVNPASGLVTAVGVGTTNITYTLVGCGGAPQSAIRTLTVNPNANAGVISGTTPLCAGVNVTYTSNGDVAGTWASSNTAVATVNPVTGQVTTLATGTTNITYTVTGCNGPSVASKTLTVNPNPDAGTVSGVSPLCIGGVSIYTSNGTTGGTWSSSNTAVATVNPTTGEVTGVGAGSADIIYTVTDCSTPVAAFKTVTVSGGGSLAGTAGGVMVCSNITVQPSGTSYTDGSCNTIATIVPSGLVPVSGSINTCVTVDDQVYTYHNIPYVQRHYDIMPVTNGANATATITLYYTQAEFDAFNLARGIYPPLPVNSSDVVGKANLLITQFHGTGTYPGNYNGGTVDLINPTDNNIVWNNTLGRWEVTFNVNGFSGFYLFTSLNNTPLPVGILSFSGQNSGTRNLLLWSTATEENSNYFELQRSTDGISFVKAGTVQAAGNSSTVKNYNYSDDISGISSQIFYYRLKMVDLSGNTKYSSIVKIRLNSKGFYVEATPNPFAEQLRLQVDVTQKENATITINGITGNRVLQQKAILNKGSNVILLDKLGNIPAGVYMLTVITDSGKQTLRVVKQK